MPRSIRALWWCDRNRRLFELRVGDQVFTPDNISEHFINPDEGPTNWARDSAIILSPNLIRSLAKALEETAINQLDRQHPSAGACSSCRYRSPGETCIAPGTSHDRVPYRIDCSLWLPIDGTQKPLAQ